MQKTRICIITIHDGGICWQQHFASGFWVEKQFKCIHHLRTKMEIEDIWFFLFTTNSYAQISEFLLLQSSYATALVFQLKHKSIYNLYKHNWWEYPAHITISTV